MPATGPVSVQTRSAVERKLNSKSGENGSKRERSKSVEGVSCASAPTSPGTLRRNKQPTVEPRYTKSTYLLIEAKKLAKEIEEERKNNGYLLRPQSGRTLAINIKKSSHSPIVTRSLRKAATNDNSSSSPPIDSPPHNGNRKRRPKSSHISDPLEIMQQVVIDGRLTPLRNSGRRKHWGTPTISAAITCEDCGKQLSTGYYSEHRGFSYCNVPCYSNIFSSPLGHVEANESCSLSDDQKILRAQLIPKLRTYNTYYMDKPCQISCREINDKYVIEGIIKVYWGLTAPVTLADSDISTYWRNFQPEDGGRNKENLNSLHPIPNNAEFTHKKLSITHKAKNVLNSTKNRYKYRKRDNNETPKKRLGCSVCNELHETSDHKTYFTPPYGTPTTLRITNHVTATVLIDMLLKKFQVKDDRKRFTLYIVYESGGQRRIPEKSYPLLARLNLGPCEDVAKVFLLDAANHSDIPQEVAQYFKFGMPVLETFLQKFHEEEYRETEKIKEKYRDYKEMLVRRMGELKESPAYMKEEIV